MAVGIKGYMNFCVASAKPLEINRKASQANKTVYLFKARDEKDQILFKRKQSFLSYVLHCYFGEISNIYKDYQLCLNP